MELQHVCFAVEGLSDYIVVQNAIAMPLKRPRQGIFDSLNPWCAHFLEHEHHSGTPACRRGSRRNGWSFCGTFILRHLDYGGGALIRWRVNTPDFSVVLFRPNFTLAPEDHLMKMHKNQ